MEVLLAEGPSSRRLGGDVGLLHPRPLHGKLMLRYPSPPTAAKLIVAFGESLSDISEFRRQRMRDRSV